MTDEEIQAWKECAEEVVSGMTPATVPREIADRLATAITFAMTHANGRWCEWGERAETVRDMIDEAIADYRKAVQS